MLTKVKVSNLSDVSEGDHIMTGTQHYLVASTDVAHSKFTGYTCEKKKAVKKECTWDPNAYNICIKYQDSFSAIVALANAEKETMWSHNAVKFCVATEQVTLPSGSEKLAEKWSDSDSDMFVTTMKTGKKHSFSDCCLFNENNELSSTQITPEIAVDEGDHLVVKDENGNYQSVLVLKHSHGNELIVMPDVTSAEQYGILDIEEYVEVYCINYKQSLPVDEVLQRAVSTRGQEVLKDCRGESSKFVSWAKTGTKELINVLKLDKEIAQVCPLQREKILCVEEIKVGDHLIRSYPRHWWQHFKITDHSWHFMITESHKSDPSRFKTIYCFSSRIQETEETLDPTEDDIYRIVYPESLPIATAIQRAKSKIGEVRLSPLARMWFIRWAKTSSDEAIEILFSNAMPASKSRICAFTQLNPGDYLVEEEHTLKLWHHYLVTEVQSPTHCVAVENDLTVTTCNLTFNEKSTYYRLNYDGGACISPGQAIAKAEALVGKVFIYSRQTFVNYIKARNDTAVHIDDLQDDRRDIGEGKI